MLFDILESEHDTIKIPNTEINRSHDYFTLLKVEWLTLFFWPQGGMWDLSSLTRDRTCTPCSGSMES